jgi:hypothetical protein
VTRTNVNLDNAAASFAIASVPLFLLRKLQADAGPIAISSKPQPSEILDELEEALKIKPRSLIEAVEPYALLVALTYKRDLSLLKRAAGLRALHHDWYTYLANVLVKTYDPTQIISLPVPGQIIGSSPSSGSTAANSTFKILRP